MSRVKRAVNAHKKRRTILKRAKGYYGAKSRTYRSAKEQVQHSLQYMYRDPPQQEARHPPSVDHAHQRGRPPERPELLGVHERPEEGRVELDRKVLSDMAVNDPAAFAAVVEVAKKAL